MAYRIVPMSARKRIALIAHDNCKSDLLAWARFNRDTLADHELHATGTTGLMLNQELGLDMVRFLSGRSAATSKWARGSSRGGSIL
jgi:methylglyoxal synthase